MNLIGRIKEIEILKESEKSNKSELVAVYGRRRIGKTFLIREVYKSRIIFEVTGLHNGTMKDQLKNFYTQLTNSFKKNSKQIKIPNDWSDAFGMLEMCIDNLKGKGKKVIFIDELPWMATKRSKFLMWFENFWNSYCTQRNDLIVVICGSAAAYMVKDIIQNKGGLHNRVTKNIRLLPFNLHETKLFLESRNIKLENYDILLLYMAIGGVPHYLEMIKKGKSVAQNIDSLCFEHGGELLNEFNEVFASLFENSNTHTMMIRALAGTNKGLTRKELLKKCKLQQSGFTSSVLNELIESGFVSQYTPFSKKNRNSLFRLSDEYCMFFLKFIEPNKKTGKGTWEKLSVKQSFKSWTGFAYETICLKHIQQIKNELGIGNVFTIHSSWKSDTAQIDLVIDRDDNRINLCEIKFYNTVYTINKATHENLRHKIRCFREDVKTRKGVYFTLITSFGLKENSYSLNIIENSITMDCLFEL
ncbi:MAG: ATP-binding protein [Bacteroidota bacterium]|nr:ATP-binding protein [Bacteroidota bacterium]